MPESPQGGMPTRRLVGVQFGVMDDNVRLLAIPVGLGIMIGTVVGAIIGGGTAIGIGITVGIIVGAVVGVLLQARSKPNG